MAEHVRLLNNYHDLVRQGKSEEAQKALERYWDFKKSLKKGTIVPQKEVRPQEVVYPKKKEIDTGLDDLVKIKGIGKETVKDIKAVYSNLGILIEALKRGTPIPLRNDIVNKLKKSFL